VISSNSGVAAQKAEKPSTSSKQWILTSILPSKYSSNPAIVVPPNVPNTVAESTYVGIYTFIIAVISLAGGCLSELKMERYLKRMNLDEYTPVGQLNKEKLLARLSKEGYIVKVKETVNGEEEINYYVGPRGKVEVGRDAVAGMVKTIYGDSLEDLDARLQRSLGVKDKERPSRTSQAAATEEEPRESRRSGRRRREESGDEESDD